MPTKQWHARVGTTCMSRLRPSVWAGRPRTAGPRDRRRRDGPQRARPCRPPRDGVIRVEAVATAPDHPRLGRVTRARSQNGGGWGWGGERGSGRSSGTQRAGEVSRCWACRTRCRRVGRVTMRHSGRMRGGGRALRRPPQSRRSWRVPGGRQRRACESQAARAQPPGGGGVLGVARGHSPGRVCLRPPPPHGRTLQVLVGSVLEGTARLVTRPFRGPRGDTSRRYSSGTAVLVGGGPHPRAGGEPKS